MFDVVITTVSTGSCKRDERPMEFCMLQCTIMSNYSEQNTCIERFTVNIEGTVWMTNEEMKIMGDALFLF